MKKVNKSGKQLVTNWIRFLQMIGMKSYEPRKRESGRHQKIN
jgi:hypothetical protein